MNNVQEHKVRSFTSRIDGYQDQALDGLRDKGHGVRQGEDDWDGAREKDERGIGGTEGWKRGTTVVNLRKRLEWMWDELLVLESR